MAGRRNSPTLRRRRLSAELRAMRAQAGLTSAEATKRLNWSGGRLTKMERGEWTRPNPQNVRDLCDLYGATPQQREYLLELARRGREKGWWHEYRNMLSEDYTTLIGLEAEAATVLTFEPLMFHGLLQTIDYARAVMTNGPAELPEDVIEKRAAIRVERQKLLNGDDPLRLWAIVDEAALHRQIGGRDVLRDQLRHVLQVASEMPKVTIQVVPFAKGSHPGMSGAFAILEFPEPMDPDAAYTENLAGELMVEEPEDVARFKVGFQHLQGVALDPSDSMAAISAAAERL
ncbi:helix-turn-helix domain-containing protein [Actinomadura atramentaria]|uniref:helix-turn-helix domain-containing protein n=1 Tax=Actinomadura atramentaria TaxID=1990 RepID=UPI000477D3E7|nr:helix-turn-helix transcriptional regulator [Actinomadura atramentaria]